LKAKWLWPALLVVLVACGGSTRVGTFRPDRVLTFGDETSAITADGRKWTVNGLGSTGAIDCRANLNWTQYLTLSFGLPFAQCNPDNLPVSSINYAAPGAKVADVALQIDQQFAAGGFDRNDLVTILAGTNDILEQYAQLATLGEAAITATLEARAGVLASQVNRVGLAGGKVLIATVPDLSYAPFARAEQAADPSIDRIGLLRRLVVRFNLQLRLGLINDGTMIGLVQADEFVQSRIRFPAQLGFVNVADAACAVALPDCTTATLVPNANGNTWLWASPTELGAGGHFQLGQFADSRARNNPFQE